jgi:hypothetical protein
MMLRTPSLALLLLAAALRSATAQQLVVVVESPVFALDTRLSAGSGSSALVVTATSDAFTLDTRLSTGSTSSSLVVTAESPAFTLDTRLTGGNPILAALVVTAESGTFALDTRLAGRREDLIVQAVSPAFALNTMWVRLRKLTRAPLGPLELYWTTNAAEFPFRPQVTDPPLGPASIWQDVTDPVTESGGLYRVPVTPSGTNRYFRLKL